MSSEKYFNVSATSAPDLVVSEWRHKSWVQEISDRLFGLMTT
ncbi:hypothetical protein [Nonomuraea sp. NPDC049750]